MAEPPKLEPIVRRSWQEIETRAKAAFLGVALGDALGATTEFMTPNEIKFKYGVHKKIIGGGWLHLTAGQVTDDTEMSLFLARAIKAADEWNLKSIADHFVQWMQSRPVDIGSTCARGIRTYLHKGSTQMPLNEWDAGNGAVMRMAPVALYTLGSEDHLMDYALQQARLTHHHPLSDEACITIGSMVQHALFGASLEELHILAQDLIRRQPKFNFRKYNGYSSAYVVDTLQTVFHYLFNTSNFKDCLIGVVNQGGDADTTGAVAGMIAGALYGLDELPRSWIRRLDKSLRKEIEALSLWLVRRSPAAKKLR